VTVLLAVLTEPIDVHLVQDHDWWEPFLVPFAVVLAGVLAAAFSWWTTSRTLRHDRQLREREATRKALDGVVDEINSAADVLNRADEASGELERSLPKRPRFRRRQFDNRLRTSMEELKASYVRLMGASFRLHLRFPDEHPIIPALATWREGINELADEYQALLDASPGELWECLRAAHETHHRLGGQLYEFFKVAQQWATAPE
jgi:hypothetical protein